MRKNLHLLLPLFLLLIAGCEPREHVIAIHNLTAAQVTEAHVRYDNFISVGGTLAPGMYKVHLGVQNLPKTVTVEWKTTDRLMHRKEVALDDLGSLGPEEMIFFELLPTGDVRTVVRSTFPDPSGHAP